MDRKPSATHRPLQLSIPFFLGDQEANLNKMNRCNYLRGLDEGELRDFRHIKIYMKKQIQ